MSRFTCTSYHALILRLQSDRQLLIFTMARVGVQHTNAFNMLLKFVLLLSTAGSVCAQTTLYRTQLLPQDHPDAFCNDGTRPVYYHSNDNRNNGKFIIFLMGGYFCDSAESCRVRCTVGSPDLCTARNDPTITGNGILSDDVALNAPLASHYKVYMHYCTSDDYVGDREASPDTGGYPFRGRATATGVVNSLKRTTDLEEATEVIVSGTSAGGRGVAFSCAHFQSLLPNANVKCIVDAAILYPVMDPFTPDCRLFNDVIREGNEFRNGDIVNFDVDTWWKTFEQKLFIGIPMFDTQGLDVYYCGNRTDPSHRATWGSGLIEVVRGLQNTHPHIGLFIPSCLGHGMLTSNAWYSGVTAGSDELTYMDAIGNWLSNEGQMHAFDDCYDDGCNSCLN